MPVDFCRILSCASQSTTLQLPYLGFFFLPHPRLSAISSGRDTDGFGIVVCFILHRDRGSFPDLILIDLNNWIDKQNPPPPGSMKLDGEYYTVWLLLDLAILVFIGVAGAFFGIVKPDSLRKAASHLMQITHRGDQHG